MLVTPGSVTELAGALAMVVDGDPGAAERRRVGLEAVARHTWPASASAHVEAYRWAAARNAVCASRATRRGPVRFGVVRALVTGARGFVGSWLTAHLVEHGDDVTGIDHEVDITDGEAVRAAMAAAAPDVVYHLAAVTHVGKSWTDPGEVLRVNGGSGRCSCSRPPAACRHRRACSSRARPRCMAQFPPSGSR